MPLMKHGLGLIINKTIHPGQRFRRGLNIEIPLTITINSTAKPCPITAGLIRTLPVQRPHYFFQMLLQLIEGIRTSPSNHIGKQPLPIRLTIGEFSPILPNGKNGVERQPGSSHSGQLVGVEKLGIAQQPSGSKMRRPQ